MGPNRSGAVTFDEFSAALSRWVAEKLDAAAAAEARGGGPAARAGAYSRLLDPRRGGATAALLAELPPDDLAALRATAAAVEAEPADDAAEDMRGGGDGDGERGEGGEGGGEALSRTGILVRAGAMLAGGVALCAAFSDPLVEALARLSKETGVPAFAVGFVLTPLASNSSEFVSSLKFAARKRVANMSLTVAQVWGAVTMNNTLVLGLFLWIVHSRGLAWVYSSEVTVIVACSLLMGALGASRSTFKAKYAPFAVALYPLSLLAVYLLDTKLGWQ